MSTTTICRYETELTKQTKYSCRNTSCKSCKSIQSFFDTLYNNEDHNKTITLDDQENETNTRLGELSLISLDMSNLAPSGHIKRSNKPLVRKNKLIQPDNTGLKKFFKDLLKKNAPTPASSK